MHHFLLARDSHSFSELFHNARFEGHPPLWNILLFLLTRFTVNPFSMQVLHLIIGMAAVGIFLWRSPFSTLVKTFFVLGYFPMYEYGVISRNYSLAILFLFACVAQLSAHRKNYGLLFLCLALLCTTHLFAVFCAVPLWLLAVREGSRDENRNISPTLFRILAAGVILVMIAALWNAVPAGGHMLFHYDTEPAVSMRRMSKGFSVLLRGLLPLPDFRSDHAWNSNFIAAVSGRWNAVPGALTLLLPLICFYKRPQAMVVFFIPSLSIACFLFCSPLLGGVRYAGFVFMLFVAALWIDKEPAFAGEESNWRRRIVIFILLVQCAGGIIAWTTDFYRPFSEGKNAAAWIRNQGLDKGFIAVSDQTAGPALCGYLARKVFYPETNAEGSFCRWNIFPFLLEKPEIARRLGAMHKDGILLKNDSTFGEGMEGETVYRDSVMELKFITKFDRAIVRTENYWVYELKFTKQ